MKNTVYFLVCAFIFTCCHCTPAPDVPFYDVLTVSNLTTGEDVSTTNRTTYIYNNITVSEDGVVSFDDEPVTPVNSIEVHSGDLLQITYENNTKSTKYIEFHIPDHTYKLDEGIMQMKRKVDWEPQIFLLSCKWFDMDGVAHDSDCKIFIFAK